MWTVARTEGSKQQFPLFVLGLFFSKRKIIMSRAGFIHIPWSVFQNTFRRTMDVSFSHYFFKIANLFSRFSWHYKAPSLVSKEKKVVFQSMTHYGTALFF